MQEGVRDAGEPGLGLGDVGEHGLAADVARGGDQRTGEAVEQQLVQRAVGQHDADLAQSGCDVGREARAGCGAHEDDRSRGIEQRGLRRRLEFERGTQVQQAVVAPPRVHDRQRLVGAALALAQARDGHGARRIAQQVVAADALHRQHPAVAQHRDRSRQRCLVAGRHGGRVAGSEGEMRTAGRAGHRFGVEAAVQRVLVLAPAGRAQRKAVHGRVGPVVGQRLDQRIARPALRAVDEGVTVPAVAGGRELGQAIGTAEEIGRHRDLRLQVRAAGGDLEARRHRRLRPRTRRPAPGEPAVAHGSMTSRAKRSSAAGGPCSTTSTSPRRLRT